LKQNHKATGLKYLCTCVVLTALTVHAQPTPGAQKQPARDCAASGTVVNALTGEPILRAMVSFSDVASEPGAASDEKGHWAIANLTCGTRMPTATRDGFLPANGNLPGAEAEKRMIQLVSGTPVTDVKIPLIPGGVVSGTVRDFYGDPLHGAQVLLMRVRTQAGKRGLSQAGSAGTDAEGNFRMDGLDRGSYVVCAGSQKVTYPAGGGEPLIYRDSCFPGPLETALLTPFRLEPGREVRTALTLTAIRGVHVRGRISGLPATTAGTPVRIGVSWIKATNSGYMGQPPPLVQPDGTFDIAPVRPGSYMASGWVSDLGMAEARVEVGSTDIDNLVLTLQPLSNVVGTVRYEITHTASGSGVRRATKPDVRVELKPAESTINYGVPGEPTWDSERLNFVFHGVTADRYRINASLPGETAYVKSVTLKGQDVQNRAFGVEGTAGPIEIVISDDTGGVDGMVNGGDGKPVAAYVVLISANGQEHTLVSGDDGHAKNENIPPGEYRAWAFDNIDSVPYAEPDWMARNAGAGEKVTVATGGTANIALKTTTVLTE
jgi:hypothetical protein